MANIVDLSVEHVLMFVIIAFLLYHLIGGCSCGMRSRDGFSVGGLTDDWTNNWINSDMPCLELMDYLEKSDEKPILQEFINVSAWDEADAPNTPKKLRKKYNYYANLHNANSLGVVTRTDIDGNVANLICVYEPDS